jgi:hypothetical protein
MAYYETNRRVIHLSKAKRCLDQADHFYDQLPRPNFRTVAHMTAAKPQKTAGYRSRRRFVVLKIAALLKGFSS